MPLAVDTLHPLTVIPMLGSDIALAGDSADKRMLAQVCPDDR